MRPFVASAPGKVLWIGGYSVLEKGNKAFVSVVGRRIFARVDLLKENAIAFEIPQLKISLEGKFEDGRINFGNVDRDALQAARFAINAAQNCLKYLLSRKKKLRGFKLTTMSDAAFGTGAKKTGLGSSAAVTVAVVAAILSAFGFNAASEKNKIAIHNLSQLSHSLAQGKVGSGFDVAAAVYGNMIYSRYSPGIISKVPSNAGASYARIIEKKWDYEIERLAIPKELLPLLAFTSIQVSTTAMVHKLGAYRKKNRRIYGELMGEISSANAEAIRCLREIIALRATNAKYYGKMLSEGKGPFLQFQEHFNDGRLLTKKLGELAGAEIENSNFTRAIQLSLQKGGYVCKLPGAGGGDTLAAICLSESDRNKLRRFWRSLKLKILDVNFGTEGIRGESDATFQKALKTNA